MTPAREIAGLWADLRANPLQPASWRSLAEAYAAADQLPQRAYTAGQWQRLQPGAEPIRFGAASASSSLPAGPTAAQADTWLHHPHTPEAQRW
ncbi:MAG: hypothetical protein ACKOPS_02275, partial [Cyanobium sp.]